MMRLGQSAPSTSRSDGFASLVPFFPATAFADGDPGPNTCRLYQVAVFPGD
jgi:hypothetical protein